MIIGIIISVVSIITCLIICINLNSKVNKTNTEIELYNKDLREQNQILIDKRINLTKEIDLYSNEVSDKRKEYLEVDNDLRLADIRYKDLKDKYNSLKLQEKETMESIAEMGKAAENTVKIQKELATTAFEEYKTNLENQKELLNNAFEDYRSLLELSYNNKQTELKSETESLREELVNAKKARAALIEAARREKEIKDNSSFYCIEVSQEDLIDIAKLETVKKTLLKPRILSMLIWQTYYQKPLKALTAKILGNKTVTGIYKITNIITGECYIGQAVNY